MNRPTRIGIAIVSSFASIIAAATPTFALSAVVRTPGYAQRWVTHSQAPTYPLDANARHITGAGIFVLRVQIRTGRVKEVVVARSTGHSILDSAASKALIQWRFKPGVLPPIKEILPNLRDPLATEDSLIKIPVSFTR